MEQKRITDIKNLKAFSFENLVEIMELLRSPAGCPWDKEQTHESIKQYMIEEAYEVLETIEARDDAKFMDELGDLLLQIVFHSQIAKERGGFSIEDVIANVCRKMILRHIHVFGDAQADNPTQALSNWESVKRREKGHNTHTQSLKDIPPHMPSLMRSLKVQKKASLLGFDWQRTEDAMLKVDEELCELKLACENNDRGKLSEEIGDLLFAVVNVARFLKIEPEFALKSTIEKFIRRFEYIERMSQKPIEQMTLSEMDELWNEAKVAFLAQNDE
jgi:tetrapyrrole methylase family protein/MazG family protein